jgi:hypothetical protein
LEKRFRTNDRLNVGFLTSIVAELAAVVVHFVADVVAVDAVVVAFEATDDRRFVVYLLCLADDFEHNPFQYLTSQVFWLSIRELIFWHNEVIKRL